MRGVLPMLTVWACVLSTQAKTVVWTGADGGDFSAAANWSGGAPAPGDVARFTSSATVTGAFDFGSAGFSLDVSETVTVVCQVDFTGAGGLVKTGLGRLQFNRSQTGSFTGGLRVESGSLCCQRPSDASWWNCYVGATTSVVELVMSGDAAADPRIDFSGWGAHLTNPVRVTGVSASGHRTFVANDKAALGGTLVAETDVRFHTGGAERDYRVGGDVTMPGRVLHAFAGGEKGVMNVGAGDYWVHRTFIGNLEASGAGVVNVTAKGVSPDNVLTAACRTALLREWQGTNVVAVGASATLTVGVQNDGKGNPFNYGSLSSNACVRLAGGAKLELVAARDHRVRECAIDGVMLAEGRYSAADLPSSLLGDGALCVGKCKEWIGGAEGLISDGANWSDGAPAVGGETLIFNRSVILGAETVDFGGGGFVFRIGRNCDVTNGVRYAGAGGIVKRGSGRLVFPNAQNGTFAGGVRIEDGVVVLAASANVVGWGGTTLGDAKGTVEVVVEGECRPQLMSNLYGVRLKNPVHVTGGAAGTNHYALATSNRGGFNRITADTDFAISCAYHSAYVMDDLVAPGHVVLVNAGAREQGVEGANVFQTTMYLDDRVEASLEKVSPANLQLEIGTTNPANAIVVSAGKVTLGYLARWEGTNIVVRGAESRLVATADRNLSRAAAVCLEDGAKIEVDDGVEVEIDRLSVDGESVRRGTYTAATLPVAVMGAGRLAVGRRGCCVLLGDAAPRPPESPVYPMHAGRRLVWGDEFNDSHLDTSKWRLLHITDRSDVTYAVDSRTLRVEDGCLHLMVQKTEGGRHPWLMPENVVTHETMGFRYGYLEMRANVPFRHGAWPAFWLQATPKLQQADWMSEVDIFEVFSSARTLNTTLHKWAGNGMHTSCSVNAEGSSETYSFADCANLNSEYHVYAMEWTDARMRFFVDGVCYNDFPITPDKDFGADKVPGMDGFHDFHSVIFSAGIFTKGSGWCPDAWELKETDEMPIHFRIDWIRLWQKPEGEELRTCF